MTDRAFTLDVHAGSVAADQTAAHHQMVGVADQLLAVGEWHRVGLMAPWAPETAADWAAMRDRRARHLGRSDSSAAGRSAPRRDCLGPRQAGTQMSLLRIALTTTACIFGGMLAALGASWAVITFTHATSDATQMAIAFPVSTAFGLTSMYLAWRWTDR